MVIGQGPDCIGIPIGLYGHAPEFDQGELKVVVADSFLSEKHRTRGGQFYEQGDRQHGRGQEQQREAGNQDVEGAFDHAVAEDVEGFVANGNHRQVAKVVEHCPLGDQIVKIGNDAESHALLLAPVDDAPDGLRVA
jgi:hypothetical protein